MELHETFYESVKHPDPIILITSNCTRILQLETTEHFDYFRGRKQSQGSINHEATPVKLEEEFTATIQDETKSS